VLRTQAGAKIIVRGMLRVGPQTVPDMAVEWDGPPELTPAEGEWLAETTSKVVQWTRVEGVRSRP
jgi:hypothetical protein